MRTLITILDNITETSMPFNEFVLYRANKYKDQRHVLIICGKKNPLPEVRIPKELKIVYAKRKLSDIRAKIKAEINECTETGSEYAIHLQQVNSALLAQLAMLGTSFRKKTLFTVHSTFSGYLLHNKIRSFLNACMARYITCVSNASYDNYPKLIKRIKKDRILCIQNGVDLERIDSIIDRDDRKPKDHVEFAYVARMIPIKNHNYLLDVIKKADHRAKFLFIGAEDEQGNIRKRIESEGLAGRVELTGLIPRNEVFRRLQNADVYISSSTLEGLPISVLEAMYAGLPAILSDIRQHAEVAGDTDLISIIPLEENKWVREINRYTQMPEEQRRSIGMKSMEYVYNAFSLDRMHKEYDKIYDKLMKA